MTGSDRREFLGSVGHGMLVASLGPALAAELGAAPARSGTGDRFRRGPEDLETLVRWMRETPAEALQPKLIGAWRQGTRLETLVAAGALANARTFGGTDYEGYHAFMSLMPAYHMAQRLPEKLQPLPVLKVLYRNTARIQRAGEGRTRLVPIEAAAARSTGPAAVLRERERTPDMAAAEADFAGRCRQDPKAAYEDLQWLVQDDIDVHRVVLPWRAWDTLQLIGRDHADTLLRQCVRHCVDRERSRKQRGDPEPAIRKDLPALLDQHKVLEKGIGDRALDDRAVQELADLVFASSRRKAADAVAAALADRVAPASIAEALTLAANRLLMHTPNNPKKRDGVHGASVGVHASDAANAWRNISKIVDDRNRLVSLVVGAYHTAGQTRWVDEKPLAFEERSAKLAELEPRALLREAEGCIRNRDQSGACAAVHRYGELGNPAEPVIELMLKYAISEDGALHAEKYFHTAVAEFGAMRKTWRWRQLVALARVTASEFGEPAPGVQQARALLTS